MIYNEVKVTYTRQTGEDNPGKVRETYLVKSINCSDAENKTIEHIQPFVFGGELDTPQIRKRQFFDIFECSSPSSNLQWYEAKVEMIVIDGDREARRAVTILVEDDNIGNAIEELKYNFLKEYDCEVVSIKKSPILDIIREDAE